MRLLLGYYVFCAIVSGMPDPAAASGVAYRWAYTSLHVLAADFSQFVKKGAA